MGRKLDLRDPKGFNDKLQWLKLNDRKPEYVGWVDKVKAKELAGSVIGNEHIVPLIAVWYDSESIDFQKIPDVCVLKCNHDQGSTIIYRRGISDEAAIRQHFSRRLLRNPYSSTREWPYSQVKPCILCEKYMADHIIDY